MSSGVNNKEERGLRISGRRSERSWNGWYSVYWNRRSCGGVRKSPETGRWECHPPQSVDFTKRKEAAEYVVKMAKLRWLNESE